MEKFTICSHSVHIYIPINDIMEARKQERVVKYMEKRYDVTCAFNGINRRITLFVWASDATEAIKIAMKSWGVDPSMVNISAVEKPYKN